MSCPTHEALIGYAARDLDAPKLQSVATHLSTDCPSCTAEIRSISELRSIASTSVVEMPPLAVLEKAARIPSEFANVSLSDAIGRLASLVFDSFRAPLPQGARSSASTSRQLLYRALDYDIDVRIAERESDAVRVSGQVLPGAQRPIESVSGVDVALVREGRAVGLCVTSDLGEFDFGAVPPGDYTLSVETDEDRILIDRLTAFHN